MLKKSDTCQEKYHALKIVRNDITKMTTEAIVNTANEYPAVGPGCDCVVYGEVNDADRYFSGTVFL